MKKFPACHKFFFTFLLKKWEFYKTEDTTLRVYFAAWKKDVSKTIGKEKSLVIQCVCVCVRDGIKKGKKNDKKENKKVSYKLKLRLTNYMQYLVFVYSREDVLRIQGT